MLAVLASPTLDNEYQRERATLESLNTALQRQGIEIRRQNLRNQEAGRPCGRADPRGRARTAARAVRLGQGRDCRARPAPRPGRARVREACPSNTPRQTADLERESLDLDLRSRRLDRDRQALVVSNLKRRVDELTVRSPVDGMVANLAAAEKANVAENAPLLTVVDLSAFEIEFQVADVYARDIKAGHGSRDLARRPGLQGRRHGDLAGSALGPGDRPREVRGRAAAGLRQSQRGSVRIVIEQRAMAVKFERSSDIVSGTRAVYVVEGDHAVLTPVELGAASVGEIEVLKGLTPGQEVVISGTGDMKDVPEFHIGG